MEEFRSFYKTVGGNEGSKCKYPTRLDVYGRGCQHDCSYCYAKSLLDFRKMWDAKNPAVADIEKVRKKIARLPQDTGVLRLGGMTDPFQPLERKEKRTYETIKALNDRGIGYLIVTKGAMVAEDDYIEVMDKNLAHVQVTITCFDDDRYRALNYEKASLPSERIKAVERLQKEGFDVSVRLSPFVPEFVDFSILNSIQCDKLLVEFLRVNTWIKKWFDIDYSRFTVKHGGYQHLPLDVKKQYMRNITGFKEVTVCEDEDEAYEYWRDHFNPNKEDCCNIRWTV